MTGADGVITRRNPSRVAPQIDLRPPSWAAQAACAQPDIEPDDFYPISAGEDTVAKAICLNCPVVDQCLRAALDQGEAHGVWGGMTADERAQLTRGPQRRAPNSSYVARRTRIEQLASRGLNDTEIAASIGVSADTVGTIRRRHGIARGVETGRILTRREVRGHAS